MALAAAKARMDYINQKMAEVLKWAEEIGISLEEDNSQ